VRLTIRARGFIVLVVTFRFRSIMSMRLRFALGADDCPLNA
jgi:hypothetical protein